LKIWWNQRLPGAYNRSPGSKLLSLTTQLHCSGHLGGRARLLDTILEEDHPMTIPSKFGSNWATGSKQDGFHTGTLSGIVYVEKNYCDLFPVIFFFLPTQHILEILYWTQILTDMNILILFIRNSLRSPFSDMRFFFLFRL
jgi:hypothetical protein